MRTIKIKVEIVTGLTIEFSADYQPFEKAETGPEAQHTGCEESIQIEQAFCNGEEIDISIFSDEYLEKVCEDYWEDSK